MLRYQVLNKEVVLLPEEEGGYSVSIPSLEGCFTQGDSVQDALANAKDAIITYLEASVLDLTPRYNIDIKYDCNTVMYIASVPRLPSCTAKGVSVEEVEDKIRVVIREYLVTALSLNTPIPSP